MAITMLCGKDSEGAVLSAEWSSQARQPIYVHTFAVGRVVATREMNRYDDSDFIATYMDDAGNFVDTVYASTRSWSYPNGATIDATPEVTAAYEAKLAADHAAKLARLALIPDVGKTVRVKAVGRGNAAKYAGKSGAVFWKGEDRSRFGTWSRGWRVGVNIDGDKLFTSIDNVEVLL